MPAIPETWKPTLGGFSKAVEGGLSINFGTSGGRNCSPQCQALKKGLCYAVHTERLKPSIQIKGERLESLGFYKACLAYKHEIEKRKAKGETFPWVRLSTFGSVPNRPLRSHEIEAFVAMIKSLPDDAPIHFPVESRQKAERFRAIAWANGLQDRLIVRLSAQSDKTAKEEHDKGNACSRIVFDGATKRERLANAHKLSRKLKQASVCPAIASTILRRPHKVKCGECKLCAQPGRLILYPQH